MNFLLAVNSNLELEFGEALSFGGQTLLLGMATVFSVLVIIWISLIVLKIFLHDLPQKKNVQKTEAPVSVETVKVATNSNDDEIIAVISAAIAAAESESSGLKFRVVSFRRK